MCVCVFFSPFEERKEREGGKVRRVEKRETVREGSVWDGEGGIYSALGEGMGMGLRGCHMASGEGPIEDEVIKLREFAGLRFFRTVRLK